MSKFRRMSPEEVNAIIKELDRWAAGKLGSKLTWEALEDRFKFSRQAMQAKSEIKAAYRQAKDALSGGLVKTREETSQQVETLLREIERQKLLIEEYQNREILWKQRWQQIAYNLRKMTGTQAYQVDKPVPHNAELPSITETAKILRPFEKEIDPTGRV